jgi:MOSC domain-containing protein YiiM
MSITSLFNTMPQTGTVQWIGIRPEKRADLSIVEKVVVDPEEGLIGDHYGGKSGKRQVTLIQQEHLDAVASIMGQGALDPGLVRRNIVVSGINLLALKERQFQIGEAILEMTGLCHPCSRMEANLGPGGYNAMRGHGGITAKVVRGGEIKKGDVVKLLPKEKE